MTKGTVIFLLGLLIMLVPSFGIPALWKQLLSVAIGIILIAIGYSLRRSQYLATLEHDGVVRSADTFVETTESLFETTR